MIQPHHRIAISLFLAGLAGKFPQDQHAAFFYEAIETGGTYGANITDGWGSQGIEIELHGIHAVGTTNAEAETNWISAATRQTKSERNFT